MPQLKKALEEGYGSILNENKVLFLRTIRDFAFATYLLESGNDKLAQKVLRGVEQKIDKKINQKNLTLFNFP